MIRWWTALSLSERQVWALGTATIGLGLAVLPVAWLWEVLAVRGEVVRVRPELVELPGGTFVMGSPEGKRGRFGDASQRTVTLSPFVISKTEVTQGMYRAVMGALPACGVGTRQAGDDLPMHCVSWEEAVAFCEALSMLEGLAEGEAYRLPTEAEWEYAARANTTLVWAGTSDADALCEFANVDGCTGRTGLRSVGQLKANAWGLHDMSGNVLEWTADWYGGRYGDDATDPAGPPSGSRRVSRGGSWRDEPALARVAYRFRVVPSGRSDRLGFRLARSLPSALSPSDPLPTPAPP